MTLGKFVSFCSDAGIKNDKIDRNFLMRKFKMLSEGKKDIEFDIFYQLMMIIAEIDESMIPRLGVDDKMSFKNKMK